jgi:hypothetical protein
MVTETASSARLDRPRGWPANTAVWSPVVATTRRPVERYGAPRPWARPLTVAVAALLALVGGGWLLWAGLYHATPSVSGQLRTYQVSSDRAVSATIDVRREPGIAAVCLLLAQASDHSVVGEREVRIPPGRDEALTLTYRIETERAATNAVLDGCDPLR